MLSRNYINASNGCNVTETNQTGCLNCLRKVEVNDLNPACSSSALASYVYSNPVGAPMIQTGSTWLLNVSNVTRNGLPTQQFILIDNGNAEPLDKQSGYHRVWDITRLRDMTVCGFYVQGTGPSFFQRMLAGAESVSNPVLGIESFLVGQWAGGAEDKLKGLGGDTLSRLDWEFYQNIDGQDEMKGMPGCKNAAMCSPDTSVSNATSEGVGIFKLSANATKRYGMDGIACIFSTQSQPPGFSFTMPYCRQ